LLNQEKKELTSQNELFNGQVGKRNQKEKKRSRNCKRKWGRPCRTLPSGQNEHGAEKELKWGKDSAPVPGPGVIFHVKNSPGKAEKVRREPWSRRRRAWASRMKKKEKRGNTQGGGGKKKAQVQKKKGREWVLKAGRSGQNEKGKSKGARKRVQRLANRKKKKPM